MKVYNKFVESNKEPYNKNDIWFDGSSWKMYKEGVWRSFTLPIELAKDIEDTVKDLELGNYVKKTDVDLTLSETSINPVGNKVITERLNTLWENLDHGTFPDLTAGDLAGRGESVPASFGFRASGGKSIKDGRAYIKRIKGNSVVWNQKNDKNTRPANGDNTQGSAPMYDTIGNETHYKECIGHKIYARAISSDANIDRIYYTDNVQMNLLDGALFTASASATNIGIVARIPVGVRVDNASINVIFHDLTQMFQAGNEPSTIEEFNARVATLGIDMYAYNEGEVIHMNTESIKSIGDNALNADRSLVFDFDGSYGNYDFINTEDAFVGLSADGYINNGAIDYAEKIEGGFRLRSNGGGYGIGLFVKALPNEEYSVSYASDNGRITFGFYDKDKKFISYQLWENRFTTPSNCEYIMLCLRDNEVINVDISFTDIMLTLVHSGWKQDTDAGYQPYWQDTLPLPIIRKYFPQGMKSAGSAHDEIRYNKVSGKWEAVQRIGSVRVADYVRRDAEGVFILFNLPKKPANNINGKYSTNVLMVGYTPDLEAFSYDVISAARIAVVDDTIWLNAENLKQYASTQEYIDAIGDTKVFYELAEPIVTELDAEDQNFRDYYQVADFGTEMSQSNVPSAPFSADIIYQFNAVDMIREHELEITQLQSIIATMQAQLASLTSNY